eukprot:scaffold746_cov293-Chaetoceros_neogracile.AAC.28
MLWISLYTIAPPSKFLPTDHHPPCYPPYRERRDDRNLRTETNEAIGWWQPVVATLFQLPTTTTTVSSEERCIFPTIRIRGRSS